MGNDANEILVGTGRAIRDEVPSLLLARAQDVFGQFDPIGPLAYFKGDATSATYYNVFAKELAVRHVADRGGLPEAERLFLESERAWLPDTTVRLSADQLAYRDVGCMFDAAVSMLEEKNITLGVWLQEEFSVQKIALLQEFHEPNVTSDPITDSIENNELLVTEHKAELWASTIEAVSKHRGVNNISDILNPALEQVQEQFEPKSANTIQMELAVHDAGRQVISNIAYGFHKKAAHALESLVNVSTTGDQVTKERVLHSISAALNAHVSESLEVGDEKAFWDTLESCQLHLPDKYKIRADHLSVRLTKEIVDPIVEFKVKKLLWDLDFSYGPQRIADSVSALERSGFDRAFHFKDRLKRDVIEMAQKTLDATSDGSKWYEIIKKMEKIFPTLLEDALNKKNPIPQKVEKAYAELGDVKNIDALIQAFDAGIAIPEQFTFMEKHNVSIRQLKAYRQDWEFPIVTQWVIGRVQKLINGAIDHNGRKYVDSSFITLANELEKMRGRLLPVNEALHAGTDAQEKLYRAVRIHAGEMKPEEFKTLASEALSIGFPEMPTLLRSDETVARVIENLIKTLDGKGEEWRKALDGWEKLNISGEPMFPNLLHRALEYKRNPSDEHPHISVWVSDRVTKLIEDAASQSGYRYSSFAYLGDVFGLMRNNKLPVDDALKINKRGKDRFQAVLEYAVAELPTNDFLHLILQIEGFGFTDARSMARSQGLLSKLAGRIVKQLEGDGKAWHDELISWSQLEYVNPAKSRKRAHVVFPRLLDTVFAYKTDQNDEESVVTKWTSNRIDKVFEDDSFARIALNLERMRGYGLPVDVLLPQQTKALGFLAKSVRAHAVEMSPDKFVQFARDMRPIGLPDTQKFVREAATPSVVHRAVKLLEGNGEAYKTFVDIWSTLRFDGELILSTLREDVVAYKKDSNISAVQFWTQNRIRKILTRRIYTDSGDSYGAILGFGEKPYEYFAQCARDLSELRANGLPVGEAVSDLKDIPKLLRASVRYMARNWSAEDVTKALEEIVKLNIPGITEILKEKSTQDTVLNHAVEKLTPGNIRSALELVVSHSGIQEVPEKLKKMKPQIIENIVDQLVKYGGSVDKFIVARGQWESLRMPGGQGAEREQLVFETLRADVMKDPKVIEWVKNKRNTLITDNTWNFGKLEPNALQNMKNGFLELSRAGLVVDYVTLPDHIFRIIPYLIEDNKVGKMTATIRQLQEIGFPVGEILKNDQCMSRLKVQLKGKWGTADQSLQEDIVAVLGEFDITVNTETGELVI